MILQNLGALLVLAQRGRALARPGVEAHQVSVRRFVEAIERQPLPGVCDGLIELALSRMALHQHLKGGG